MNNIIFINTDISLVGVDAIVLPANTILREGSGASRALFQAAGRRELTQACKNIGHVDVGSAVVTDAFRLNAQFIIHACVPKWEDGQHDEYNLLSSAYLSALKMADLLACRTIAFPLLAAGNNKFDKSLAFEIAVKSIQTFEAEHLQQVVMVLYEEDIVACVQDQGYPVISVMKTVSPTPHPFMKKSKTVASSSLKASKAPGAGDFKDATMKWFMNKNNQKILLDVGFLIFEGVIRKDNSFFFKAAAAMRDGFTQE